MSEVDYESARAWAPHTHWRAFFALLLRGGYVEALGRTELGYRPEIALEEGMRRSISWCIECGLLGPAGEPRALSAGSGAR